jgi:hypothetical protein
MLPAVPPTIVPTLKVGAGGVNSLIGGNWLSSSSCSWFR